MTSSWVSHLPNSALVGSRSYWLGKFLHPILLFPLLSSCCLNSNPRNRHRFLVSLGSLLAECLAQSRDHFFFYPHPAAHKWLLLHLIASSFSLGYFRTSSFRPTPLVLVEELATEGSAHIHASSGILKVNEVINRLGEITHPSHQRRHSADRDRQNVGGTRV